MAATAPLDQEMAAATSHTFSSRGPPGEFKDGRWYCACEPRKLASFLTVKKEGKNKGRNFYTCPNPVSSGNQCQFFLWLEDAEKFKRELFNQHLNHQPSPTSFSLPSPANPNTLPLNLYSSPTPTSTNFVLSAPTSPGNLFSHIHNLAHFNNMPVMNSIENPGGASSTDARLLPIDGSEGSKNKTTSNTSTGAQDKDPHPATEVRRFGIFRGIPRDDVSSSDEEWDSKRIPVWVRIRLLEQMKKKKALATTKRKRSIVDEDDISSDDELVTSNPTDKASVQKNLRQRKLSGATDPITPANNRKKNVLDNNLSFDGLPTPQSANTRFTIDSMASTPGTKRFKNAEARPVVTGPASQFVTPTPVRFRDAMAHTNPTSGGLGNNNGISPTTFTDIGEDEEITIITLGFLQAEPGVSPSTQRTLREVLNRWSRRARGIEQSRTSLRATIREKDRIIAELREKVAKLEEEQRARRDVLMRAAAGELQMAPPQQAAGTSKDGAAAIGGINGPLKG
ncbi:hypothetical protein VTJ04DRAFT_1751 [Mycothermus thermophilus]|uniref:uncharacterized protein n=1 Tax=Humicola insolens TaxID=85995 RepID=UPI003742D7F4